MSWKMMDLSVRQLNAEALRDWKETFLSMSIWMQAILVGVLVLLIGASALSCWWGFRMTRSARFAAGATSTFFIVLILLTTEYPQNAVKALLISAGAGVWGGVLYVFLERAFHFLAGFVLGTVFAAWLLPKVMHLEPGGAKGGIWALVIALAAGAVFALLTRKLKIVLTALEGGVVLGLLVDAFLPVSDIPWISEKLSEAQLLNLLPLVLAATGMLIQLLQFLSIRAEQKSLQIPAGEEREGDGRSAEGGDKPGNDPGSPDDHPGEPEEDTVSIEQAEEVLVEKAKELALAAARSTQQTRLRERCEDVSQGLYSAKTAADRLGMSEESFLQEMKRAGYTVPEEENAAGAEETEENAAGAEETEENAAGAEETEENAAGAEETEENAAGAEEAKANASGAKEAEASAVVPEDGEANSAGAASVTDAGGKSSKEG